MSHLPWRVNRNHFIFSQQNEHPLACSRYKLSQSLLRTVEDSDEYLVHCCIVIVWILYSFQA